MLMKKLRLSRRDTVGLLAMLWDFACEFAPDGVIGRWTGGQIAEALEWPSDRTEELVTALVETGWLDSGGDAGSLTIHDWQDHCPDYIRKRLARRKSENGGQCPPLSAERRTTADNGGQCPPVQPSPTQPKESEIRAREPDPDLVNLGFKCLGDCATHVAAWLESYPRDWVASAMLLTKERNPGAPIAYCRGVLESYQKQGGPANGKSNLRPGRSGDGSGGQLAAKIADRYAGL